MLKALEEAFEDVEAPGISRQWEILCDTCGARRSGEQSKRPDTHHRCCRCGNPIAYRKSVYRCEACATLLRQVCARNQHQAAPVSRPPAALEPVAAGISDDPNRSDETAREEGEELLRVLRLLPAAFPRAPILWIPRKAKQQVAAVLRERLAEATRQLNAAAGDPTAERAHLLCRAASQLLLRPPPA